MLTKSNFFLVLFALFSVTTAFNTLVPWDKELVYEYKALVKAGTHTPSSFVSQFILHGKLHLQANNNATWVKLTDLTYKLYNGILDHEHEYEAHDVPLPTDVKELQEVFKIIYSTDGKAIGIATSAQENEYTRNIKKAIAAILQLDTDAVKKVDHPHAFVTKEHSIYGYGDMLYNAMWYGDELIVHKMHEMHSTHHMYQYTVTNLEPHTTCETFYEDPLTHDSQRKYLIVTQDGHQIVKHVEANGGMYYHPFRGQSEAHYLFVNQTFDLVQTLPLQTHFEIPTEHFDNHLTYYMYDKTVETVTIPDLTNGRRKNKDMQKFVPMVYKLLEDIWEYLHTNQIHAHSPHIEHGELFNRMREYFMHFDKKKLEEIYNTLVQKTSTHDVEILNIFYHILPLVGTKASSIFIKDLIVQKKLKTTIAIELLQKMTMHIKLQTQSYLTSMEELIHLSEDIPWEIRRVAILSFCTLIYKVHEWEMRISKDPHQYAAENHLDNPYHYHYVQEHDEHTEMQNAYEKYVVEFVTKIKTTPDFKTQMTYLCGLFNMKLESIVKHLEPALYGKWWPGQHFKFYVMWTIFPIVKQHPDKLFEIYWPILCNPKEYTELRIAAYHIIMKSYPNLSRFMNVFWCMMDDPNEEMYSFHYNFMKAMMHTTEPCYQYFKIKAMQLFKYMHPPSHGISTYKWTNFKDMKYGFSGGLETVLYHTNTTNIMVFEFFTQLFNKPTQDMTFIIKLHGMDYNLADVFKLTTMTPNKLFNLEDLMKVITQIPTNKNIRIETVWIKYGHVMDCTYFDGSNIQEFTKFFDFFTTDKQSFEKSLMYITYEKFTRVLMPTDLGFLGLWDFMIPVVDKYNIKLTKEVTNKVISLRMDNNIVKWVHVNHGLSFYNSITNILQGINSFHCIDFKFPMFWDMSLNMQQQSMKISFKKHGDTYKDIAGYRSYVTSAVFVKDDYHENVLMQSSPHLKDLVLVTEGENYKYNYTLLYKDDLNTGRKWDVMVYNSEHSISNGTFDNFIYSTILSPKGKYFENPWEHFLLILEHYYQYTTYHPIPGTYGLLLKVVPSEDYDVTNIDLFMRFNYEINREGFVFTPGFKSSFRLTYAVKNEAQSLKTWDINFILDMIPGHTLNSLKMQLTRIIPGQKDYKVCVEGVKKWSQATVTGHLNVAMSKTDDGKCTKDDSLVDVTMTGERSYEQKHKNFVYGACQYPIPYFIEHYHTMKCLADHTSLRKYVYNVKTNNIPSEFKKTMLLWWDYFKAYYMSHYNYLGEHTENIGDNNFKVEMDFPADNNKMVDFNFVTAQNMHEISGIPTDYWTWFGFSPDVTLYSQWYMFMHSLGWIRHCYVYHDHMLLDNYHHVEHTVSKDWEFYIGEAAQNPQQAVYIKHLGENLIGLKLVEKTHILEIIPQGDNYKFILDGQQLPMESMHFEKWVTYQVFTHDVAHPVVITMPHFGLHFEFDGHFVQVVIPKTDHSWYGQCFTY